MSETVHSGNLGQVVVPIRSLGPNHRGRVASHLLSLDSQDRYLRFGYMASDTQINAYVNGLNFERDEIYGIYNRGLQLIAMAHLALAVDPFHSSCAEFGVSVLKKARGKGYGTRLFERAVMHARNVGVDMLFIHALSENLAMIQIARKGGAVLERAGSETDAHLRLPTATLDSRMSEIVGEQLGMTDYRLKHQAKSFWDFLEGMQEVRQGIREARHKAGQ